MELRLVGAIGLGKGSLVSMKVGGKRSLVPFDADALANGSFKFPGLSGSQQVKLDVYEHVAQARLIAEPVEARWEVALVPSEAQRLRVDGPTRTDVSLELEMRSPRADEDGGSDRLRSSMLAARTQPYIKKHNVMEVLQALLQSVIKEMPQDPCAYMIQVLQNCSGCNGSAEQPDGPRCDGRPQSASGSTCRRQRPLSGNTLRARPGSATGAATAPPRSAGTEQITKRKTQPDEGKALPPLSRSAPLPGAVLQEDALELTATTAADPWWHLEEAGSRYKPPPALPVEVLAGRSADDEAVARLANRLLSSSKSAPSLRVPLLRPEQVGGRHARAASRAMDAVEAMEACGG